MKKLLVTLCAIVFMIAALTISVFADSSTLTASVDNDVVKAGDTIEINVSLKNNPGLYAIFFEMPINPEVFEFVGKDVSNSIFKSDNYAAFDAQTNSFKLNRASDSVEQGVNIDGTICSIKLKIKDSAKDGVYVIEAIPDFKNTVDMDGQGVYVDSCAVKITVNTPCPHTNKTKTEAKPSNCAEQGNNAYYICSDCGTVLKEDGKTETTVEAEKLPLSDHKYVKHEKDKPTHDKEGMEEYYTCSVCPKIFNAAKEEVQNTDGFKLGVIPHTFGEEWKSDETGHWHVCECGEKTIAEKHTPKEVIDTKPTEDKAGVGHDECEVCGYVTNEGKVIPPLKCEHTMEKVDAKDATCAEEGNIEHYTCTKCHKNFSDEAGKNELASVSTPKNPENHTGETKTEVGKKEPTCGDKGYTGDTICAGCEAVLEKGTDIEPTGEHKNTEVRGDKKADCIHEGYTGDTYCLDCKTKIETGTKIDPTGIHDFEWVTVEQATIDKTGLELQVCTVCNEEGESRVIPPIDCFHEHMEYHEKVAATCINTGTCKYWHCPDCGKNYSDEKGEREIKDLVLDKDPNNHVNTELRNVKSATCSAEGYTGDKYCSDCNKLIENGSTIPVDSNAHKYVNNRCEYCGKQLVIYPSGYIYVNNEYHISGPVLARHIPDSMTMHTDGVYEWRYCAYCHHEYDKVAVVDINVGDSVDLIVDDPVQSGDDEPIPDVPATEPEPTEPAEPIEDNNPPTGVAIAVLPMVLAAAAAISSKKMNK